MSKTPNYEEKVKKILGSLVPGEQICALTGEKWLMTGEEIGWYRKFNVPPSKLAPETRRRFLFGFPVGLAAWYKPQAETGQKILSCVHQDSPFKVLPDKEWLDRDFSRTEPVLQSEQSFFEQFKALAYTIPVAARRDDGSNINTLGFHVLLCQDAYLMFCSGSMKHCFNSAFSFDCEESTEVLNSVGCFNSAFLSRVFNSNNCIFSLESRGCDHCAFLFDCRNCRDCFGTTNKRNKQFIFFNEQLTKEEYQERISQIDLASSSQFENQKNKFWELLKAAIWPENFNTGDIDSGGEYLENCVRCQHEYNSSKSTDGFFSSISFEFHNSAFSTRISWGSDTFYSCDTNESSDIKFCFRVWRSRKMEYCMDCMNCENCFGCFGLQRKSFHIFNVSYTEEEYWQKVDEIKCAMLERGEYGEFFPAIFSAVGFQFSMGDAFFGYSADELQKMNVPMLDPNSGAVVITDETKVSDVIFPEVLPDSSLDSKVNEYIGRPILDSKIGRKYSITSDELALYRHLHLPLPHQHFLTRLSNLIRMSNFSVPELTECQNCQKKITTYKNATFSERKVFCLACYNQFLEENN